jgi:hypothetical protein
MFSVFSPATSHGAGSGRCDTAVGAPGASAANRRLPRARRSGQHRAMPHPPGFVPPCIPTLAAKPSAEPDWIQEIEHDGNRLQVRREGEAVRLFTRRGYDWSKRGPRRTASAVSMGRGCMTGESGDEGVQRGAHSCGGHRSYAGVRVAGRCGHRAMVARVGRLAGAPVRRASGADAMPAPTASPERSRNHPTLQPPPITAPHRSPCGHGFHQTHLLSNAVEPRDLAD